MKSDPVLKALVETAPADWLPLLGLPRRRVSIEDADVAELSLEITEHLRGEIRRHGQH